MYYLVVRARLQRPPAPLARPSSCATAARSAGKRDSMHPRLLETIYETANVLELRQSFYTPPPLVGGGV